MHVWPNKHKRKNSLYILGVCLFEKILKQGNVTSQVKYDNHI